MQLENSRSTSDALGRYYTKSNVGELLVNAIAGSKPGTVLDLGSGDGALTTAAARVWGDATYFTVDIDKSAASAKFGDVHGKGFKHHVGDALASSIEKRLGLGLGSADLALCNPPYIRPKWRKNFGSILEDAGLSGVVPKLADVSADVLFIAQNLRFLKKGGRLGLILPDGFIAGEKFSVIRNLLVKNHCLERVIELPRHIFKNTEAKAHIVILSKSMSGNDNISVQRLEADGQLSRQLLHPYSDEVGRLDYSYLMAQSNIAKTHRFAVGEIASDVRRGNISSAQRGELNFPVLHTTDLDAHSASVPRQYLLSDLEAQHVSGIVAVPGDIVLARVGRNLEEKVVLVTGGNVVISDSLFRLRVCNEFRHHLFRFLKSHDGRHSLSTSSHGVGAKFLTKDAILKILFNIYDY